MYKDYEHLLEITLRKNQIMLFDLEGKEKILDYQRHIYDYMDEIRWTSEEQRIITVLQLTLDVWASWEIHVRNSNYSLPHFSGIHMEEQWLENENVSSPCIILSNHPITQKNEILKELPIQINWRHNRILGPIETRQFIFDNCGKYCRAWRIYLSDSE